VVTDIPPVHALVAQVMGDLGRRSFCWRRARMSMTSSFAQPGGAVADAELVVWIGPELTPWLDKCDGNPARRRQRWRCCPQKGR
jgi:zinc transport system substrate-binding protein